MVSQIPNHPNWDTITKLLLFLSILTLCQKWGVRGGGREWTKMIDWSYIIWVKWGLTIIIASDNFESKLDVTQGGMSPNKWRRKGEFKEFKTKLGVPLPLMEMLVSVYCLLLFLPYSQQYIPLIVVFENTIWLYTIPSVSLEHEIPSFVWNEIILFSFLSIYVSVQTSIGFGHYIPLCWVLNWSTKYFRLYLPSLGLT